MKLAHKPSGCVIWVYFDDTTLALGPFLYFGAEPGKPLPSIEEAKVARHSKGDQHGFKAERANIRELNKGQFQPYESVQEGINHCAAFDVGGENNRVAHVILNPFIRPLATYKHQRNEQRGSSSKSHGGCAQKAIGCWNKVH